MGATYFILPHPVYNDEAAYAFWVGQHGKESSTNVASASHFVAVRLKQYAFVAGPNKFCTNATNEDKTVQQQWKQYFTDLMTQPTVSNECYQNKHRPVSSLIEKVTVNT